MRCALFAAAVVMIAACATIPSGYEQQRSETLWKAHAASLDDFTDWRVNARIAVTTADDGGNVRMIWRQQGDAFDVRFSAAFGQGATRISQGNTAAVLVDSTGVTTRGPSAEDLLYERVGWRVPIEQLREWLIGRPGDTKDYTLEDDGLLASAQLDGWTVEFQRYNRDETPVLPTRMSLRREDIRVRVVVDGWSHLGDSIQSKRLLVPEAPSTDE